MTENEWITHTVFKSRRDRFGHEATYPTVSRAQRGADALKREGYETRIVPWGKAFRVQYRKGK